MDEYDRLWGMRQYALKIGDLNMALEIEAQMNRLGFSITGPPLEDTPAMKERAVSHQVPSKRGKR